MLQILNPLIPYPFLYLRRVIPLLRKFPGIDVRKVATRYQSRDWKESLNCGVVTFKFLNAGGRSRHTSTIDPFLACRFAVTRTTVVAAVAGLLSGAVTGVTSISPNKRISFLPPPPPPSLPSSPHSPMENPDRNPNPKDPPVHPNEEEDPHVEEEEEDEEDDDEVEEEKEEEEEESRPQSRPSRTPFTNLNQVDRDLALARTLQEQERAYMMLRMGGEYAASESGSEYDLEEYDGQDNGPRVVGEHGSVEEGSEYEERDVEDEDAFDVQEGGLEIDPTEYADDEAYARALQEAEEREVAVRLMALTGINDWVTEEREDHGSNSQETWQDVDPDDFSYEELIALGEAVGTESRGLSSAAIASLPSVSFKAQSGQDEHSDQCVICRLDYEDGDSLIVLPCKHTYHSECINKWLQINKVCPVCSAEVSTS